MKVARHHLVCVCASARWAMGLVFAVAKLHWACRERTLYGCRHGANNLDNTPAPGRVLPAFRQHPANNACRQELRQTADRPWGVRLARRAAGPGS